MSELRDQRTTIWDWFDSMESDNHKDFSLLESNKLLAGSEPLLPVPIAINSVEAETGAIARPALESGGVQTVASVHDLQLGPGEVRNASWSISAREAKLQTVRECASLFLKICVPLLIWRCAASFIPALSGFYSLPLTAICWLIPLFMVMTLIICFSKNKTLCERENTLCVTNRRLIKIGTNQESFDFRGNSIELTLRKTGSDSGLLEFRSGVKHLSMFSNSLERDLASLPAELSGQVARLKMSRIDDSFYSDSKDREGRERAILSLLQPTEKLIGVFQTNLAASQMYLCLFAGAILFCYLSDAFMQYVMQRSCFWMLAAIASPIGVMLPLNYYLRNKNAWLIVTNRRILRITSTGRVKFICSLAGARIARTKSGTFSLDIGLEQFTFGVESDRLDEFKAEVPSILQRR